MSTKNNFEIEVFDAASKIEELPDNWSLAPIRELLEPLSDGNLVHQGWSPKCHSEAAPTGEWGVLKTTAIQDGDFLPQYNKHLPKTLEPKPKLEVRIGDILLTCAGPRLRCGVPALVRETRSKLLLSGKMYRMRANPIISNPVYLESFLRSPETQTAIDEMKTGISESGMNITHQRFSTLQVPLPPLAEQVRIADKLDALLARVEAGRERLERVPKLLKRFRQSVLSAAVSGELTREWRGGGDVEWAVTTLGTLLTYGPKNGLYKHASSYGSGTRIIRIGDFYDGKLNSQESFKRVEANEKELGDYQVFEDDIIINRVNSFDYLGKSALVVELLEPALFESNMMLVRVNDNKLLSKFLIVYLTSTLGMDELRRNAKHAVNQASINQSDVKGSRLRLPSLPEQAEIVRRVESLLAIADRIEAKYAAALSSFDRLTPALLAKAFRGELVPQDPNDEPASVLLDRIRAAREAEGGKRGRGRPAKAAAGGSGDGAEVKRRGRPPGANAQAGAEGAEPKQRGRPPKVPAAVSEPDGWPAAVPEAVEAGAAPRGRGRPPGAGIPQASSFEDALRKLEAQKLARTQGARQVGLFDDAE